MGMRSSDSSGFHGLGTVNPDRLSLEIPVTKPFRKGSTMDTIIAIAGICVPGLAACTVWLIHTARHDPPLYAALDKRITSWTREMLWQVPAMGIFCLIFLGGTSNEKITLGILIAALVFGLLRLHNFLPFLRSLSELPLVRQKDE